jgi:hypothetical protein
VTGACPFNPLIDFPYGPPNIPGTSDGLRADWALGPLTVQVAAFRELFATATWTPGSGLPALPAGLPTGNIPQRDNYIVSVSSSQLIPGWTLTGSYYVQALTPQAHALAFGGRGWEFAASGTLWPGVSTYANYATWTGRGPGAAFWGFGTDWPQATAWRFGGTIDLARVAGITTFSPTLDLQYHQYGPMSPECAFTLWLQGWTDPAGFNGSGCFPSHTYATTITGQTFAWNMRGWYARLNLTLSPRTRAWILYESGTVLDDGVTWFSTGTVGTGSYYEWWLRLEHTLSPNTRVTLNYYKGNASPSWVVDRSSGLTTGRDYLNFYRAELLYNW